MRGEKGKTIQTAVWILKTSAADAKDTQKGFTSVASRRVGGDWFAFRKGKFFCFWRKLSHWDALKIIPFGCWAVTFVDSRKRHDFAACLVVWAKRPKWNSVFAPSLHLVVFVGGESHLHTWFPLSQGSTERSPQGKQTDRKLQGRPSPRTFKKPNVLCQSELICLFFSKRCWSNTLTTLECRSFVVQQSNVKLPKNISPLNYCIPDQLLFTWIHSILLLSHIYHFALFDYCL